MYWPNQLRTSLLENGNNLAQVLNILLSCMSTFQILCLVFAAVSDPYSIIQIMCVPYSEIEMDDVPLLAPYPFLDISYA